MNIIMELEKMDKDIKENNESNCEVESSVVELAYTKEDILYSKNNYFNGNVLCLWYDYDNHPRIVIGPHCKLIIIL
jgi:hypothetical protein